ncbi:MAG: chromosomal replication initiation ATPase DnaA [Paracoccaceae bacterium]|jgi:chromosomal replication initiation ATPase DnaA
MTAPAPGQLPLTLPVRAARGRDAFFETDANTAALSVLDNWRGWPLGRMALVGPKGSGKTHMLHVWAEETGAVVLSPDDLADADVPALALSGAVAVDDADRIAKLARPAVAEITLFHLYNLLGQEGGALLLSGRTPPSRWKAGLPDLKSRLSSLSFARIGRPDDVLVQAVVVKLFADRQVMVRATVPPLLALHLGRDLAALERAVDDIDRFAMARRREVTASLTREALDAGAGLTRPRQKNVTRTE